LGDLPKNGQKKKLGERKGAINVMGGRTASQAWGGEPIVKQCDGEEAKKKRTWNKRWVLETKPKSNRKQKNPKKTTNNSRGGGVGGWLPEKRVQAGSKPVNKKGGGGGKQIKTIGGRGE